MADDIVVYGEGDTMVEANLNHDMNLKNLLKRCQEKNLKLNMEKMLLKLREVKYIGHKITRNSAMADNEKIEAIRQL